MPGTGLRALCVSSSTLQSSFWGKHYYGPQFKNERPKAEVIKLGHKLLRRLGLQGSMTPWPGFNHFTTFSSFSVWENTSRACTKLLFCIGLAFLLTQLIFKNLSLFTQTFKIKYPLLWMPFLAPEAEVAFSLELPRSWHKLTAHTVLQHNALLSCIHFVSGLCRLLRPFHWSFDKSKLQESEQ